LFLLIPVEAETGAESRWEEADTADRGLGDQFNGVDNLPRHPCPLPDSSCAKR